MTQPEQLPSQPEKSLFTRRQFMGASAIAAAAFALPKSAYASEGNCKQTNGAINLPCSNHISVPTGADFNSSQVKNIVSSGGSVTETFTTQIAQLSGDFTPNKQDISVRTYNCSVPGPNFFLNPGDRINITLENEFPANDATTCPVHLQESYTPGCFNTTNLHFHGLHVSPKCTSEGIASDSVLVEVEPGKVQQYCVQLPEFHAPGTHWYHSHLHGATGLQVSNGLAGAIIIKEPPANQIVPPDRDKVWLIQEVIGGLTNETDIYPQQGQQGFNIPANYLVNGLYKPTITVNKKQWQRWRFINAGATPRSLTNLKLVRNFNPSNGTYDSVVGMYLMAVDGISFYGKKPQSTGTDGWNLAPGNRADFIFWLSDGVEDNATLYLIKDKWVGVGASNVQLLATIKVTTFAQNGNDPEPSSYTIPGQLPDYLQPIEYQEIFGNTGALQHPVQDIRFTIPKGTGQTANKYGQYDVNEKQYQVTDEGIDVGLNTAEIWTLRNIPPGSPHPFHIHVNPFQKVGDKIDPTGPNDSSNWRWWDTIAVASNSCVPIIHRFPDYDGEYVLHCHILIHEDLGMMLNVNIKDDGTGIEPCTELSKSTFTPSQNPQYVTCEQVFNNLPTYPSNPNCTNNCNT